MRWWPYKWLPAQPFVLVLTVKVVSLWFVIVVGWPFVVIVVVLIESEQNVCYNNNNKQKKKNVPRALPSSELSPWILIPTFVVSSP